LKERKQKSFPNGHFRSKTANRQKKKRKTDTTHDKRPQSLRRNQKTGMRGGGLRETGENFCESSECSWEGHIPLREGLIKEK